MNAVFRRKIERLKDEILYLENNKARFLKELASSVEAKKIVERSVYLCAEIALDITEMAIALKGLPRPSSYSDAIYKLGEYRLIPKDFSRRFVYMAGLRNFLAHDYEVDTTSDLKRFLRQGIGDLKKFISLMEKL
jgi:uncharacterized protein YutE (UPF0331/DUF86 family)